jgi:hypothetical protein
MPVHTPKGLFERATIQRLAQTSPWLSGVLPEGKLLFEHIRDAITSVKDQDPPYFPYLYEKLMTDVSRALDRCLAYRRECAGLESQAVSRALEYELFQNTALTDDRLNNLLTDTTALAATKAGQQKTKDNLDGSADPLKLLEPSFGGSAAAADATIVNQNAKRDVLKSRLQILTDYQTNLQLRHTTPGHALNYAERRDRVVALIKQDIAEAYQKAIAARAGMISQLRLVENPDFAFPVPANDDTDVDLLDRFVMWARDMIRAYELYGEKEVTFDLVVPLVMPYASDFAGGSPKTSQYYKTDQFQSTLTDITSASGGLFHVDLNLSLPVPLRPAAGSNYFPNVRLRGIGLSVGVPSNYEPSASWSAIILLPSQVSPYDTVQLPHAPPPGQHPPLSRPPVVLGRVFGYRYDTSPAFSSGDEVWNADPTADVINILIAPMALKSDTQPTVPRFAPDLKDLKLHVRLCARPSQLLKDWQKPVTTPPAPAPLP